MKTMKQLFTIKFSMSTQYVHLLLKWDLEMLSDNKRTDLAFVFTTGLFTFPLHSLKKNPSVSHLR